MAAAFSHGEDSKYICAINFVWLDHLVLAMPHLPINEESVEALIQHYFHAGPAPMNLQTSFHVACGSVANAEAAVQNHNLRLVSPPEMVFAIVKAVARDLKEGDPDKISEWCELLTCLPCTLHLVSGEDKRHLLAVQERENYAQNASSMRLTALQKLFDVQSVLDRKKTAAGSLTLEELEAYYRAVKWSKDSEPVTSTYLYEANYVLKHLLPHQGCLDILLELEKYGRQNPLDSCGKLNKLVRRAGQATNTNPCSPEVLQKILEFLADFWMAGYYRDDRFADRALDGKQAKADGKGTVDLILLKLEILELLRGKFMDMRSFKAANFLINI